MPDHEHKRGLLRELLTELDRLAAVQRSLDLRDPEALDRLEREVEHVRRRIAKLEIQEPV